MATKYRKICPKIWNDEKFVSLSDNGKLVFFFLLTHPHMTPLGAMRATTSGLASELGWTHKAFMEAFEEVLAVGMAKANAKASCMAIPKFLKHNQPESPNVVTAWVACVDDIPECDLRDECMRNAEDQMASKSKAFGEAFSKAFSEDFRKAYRKAMPKTIGIQEQEQEQEQEQYQEELHLVGKTENEPLEKVLKRLNELRESNWEWASYRPLTSEKKKNTEHITALLNSGSTVDELIVVLEWKAANDKGNEVARRYFDCVTPFRPKHWENNIALATDWDAKGRPGAQQSGNGKKGSVSTNAIHWDDDDEVAAKLQQRMAGGAK